MGRASGGLTGSSDGIRRNGFSREMIRSPGRHRALFHMRGQSAVKREC